mmetsp:Transcript_58081/g.137011  ORF Transcript_58081/g.137011 Transcript_58081/m.137011 type:complete len:81 (+) Transcript_58081:2-244(+)
MELTTRLEVVSLVHPVPKFFVPASKFTTRGVMKYENGSDSQLKFFDYNVMVYAYSNYSTIETSYVGRVNEFIGTLMYRDA